MNYLGVDFGTSNCVACAHDSHGEIQFVPLENGQIILPTVLFVPRVLDNSRDIDETELEKRVQQSIAEEKRRFNLDQLELESILVNFDANHKPRALALANKSNRIEQLQPLTTATLSNIAQDAQGLDEQNLSLYEKELDAFHQEKNQYREKQLQFIRPLATESSIRNSVIASMQRELSEEAEAKYWNQTFFSALNSNTAYLFGQEAIHAYAEDPLGGFYLRSPKTFLGADLKKEYQEFFIKIIASILTHIKKQSETFFSREFKGIVLGRPINYHGTRGEVGNEQALELMRSASVLSGFEDIHFYFEPQAAALTLQDHAEPQQNILIIDIGGGTTDCSMLNIDARHQKREVLANVGARIGGTDFDQSIAWSALMPSFGKGTFLKNNLPVPVQPFLDAISTRDLPAQIKFRQSNYEITNLIKDAQQPELLKRLLITQELQLQHKLLIESERLKIGISNQKSFTNDLSFIEPGFKVSTEHPHFLGYLARPIKQIVDVVLESILIAKVQPDVVYLTGGMSQSKELIDELRKLPLFVDKRIIKMESMASVGKGLGIAASEMSNPTKVKRSPKKRL
jgi:hypothetical chaperone protein